MTIFQTIIMLIDEQGQIVGNHEQISYMSVHDCNTKYNIYLLYSSQPTNLSINYSIRIDAFDKITLDYWTSWYLSIPFSFLPVNRIATELFTYDLEEEHKESCSLSCENHRYSGSLCNIQHTCSYANDSFCLTSSTCICPLDKIGPKFYL
ncbi:unnamed protein product [Rotaria sp. Silwood1]|nr:unnamed protein product [Rotaria sp. Silwood1]